MLIIWFLAWYIIGIVGYLIFSVIKRNSINKSFFVKLFLYGLLGPVILVSLLDLEDL